MSDLKTLQNKVNETAAWLKRVQQTGADDRAAQHDWARAVAALQKAKKAGK